MSERPWTGVQIVGASNGVGVIIEDGIAHDLKTRRGALRGRAASNGQIIAVGTTPADLGARSC
jgi:hypothetical protein